MTAKKIPAQKSKKVIISCAITGSIHTPSMSPYLPVTPDQIAEQSVQAARVGAAIIHLHARKPTTGEPTSDNTIFSQFIPRIEQDCDAIINISTGGGLSMSLDDRLNAAQKFQPELCSLNMGSINFDVSRAAKPDAHWKNSWEQLFLKQTDNMVFKNTFRDIAYIIDKMNPLGTRFEYECYDVGHLYNLAHFAEQGIIKPPYFIQFIFGVMGGIGADTQNMDFMKQTADKLFGKDYIWSVLGAGRHQFPMAEHAIQMGGNVRVGLEDNLYIAKDQLAKNNAEQVLAIRKMIEQKGLQVAGPDETRDMLGLKGR